MTSERKGTVPMSLILNRDKNEDVNLTGWEGLAHGIPEGQPADAADRYIRAFIGYAPQRFS